MSGDFSRLEYNPKKSYTKVLMQQGRVILDADWNEMQSIQNWKNETMVTDLIGNAAFPVDYPAFTPKISGGLIFDGEKDFLLIEQEGPNIGGNKPFTFEAIITPQKNEQSMAIVSQWQELVQFDFNSGFTFGINTEGCLFFLRSIRTFDEIKIDELIATTPLKFDLEQRVTVTYNGKFLKLFMDGICVAEEIEEKTNFYEFGSTIIGANLADNIPKNCFKGIIKEAFVWSRCLNDVDLELASSQFHQIQEIGLQAWWALNENSGDIAFDITCHGYDGRLGAGVKENFPKWVNNSFDFKKGRMYLNGITCEQFENVQLQPPKFTIEESCFLAYVDMKQIDITGIEDNDILEPALGNVETTMRQKNVMEVKFFPEKGTLPIEELKNEWANFLEPYSRRGRLKVSVLTNHPIFNNCLYRVQIFKETDLRDSQLIEIVWINDNSSLKFPIQDLKQNSFKIQDLTNANTVLKVGDYFSLINDDGEKLQKNKNLLKIEDIDYENKLISFKGDLINIKGQISLEHWQSDIIHISPNNDEEYNVNIDNRLKLTFENNCFYQENDYWLIPARRVTNNILWQHNLYKNINGTCRYFAEIAEFRTRNKSCWIHKDKRRYFYSASEGEEFIRKTGGTFTGPVVFQESVHIKNDIEINGFLNIKGEVSDHFVGTSQLKDHAVNYHKIQQNLGLHLGQCILSQCPIPTPGFSKIGKIIGDTENSIWREMSKLLPFKEPFSALNVGNRTFILYGKGDIYEIIQNEENSQIELLEKAPRPSDVRSRFATCAFNEHIYVAGGQMADGQKSQDFFRYSLIDDKWHQLKNLKHPVSHLSLCAAAGHIYAIGGLHTSLFGLLTHDPSNKNERYNIETNHWEEVEKLPDYRYSASAVEVNGLIHFIGGSDKELSGILSTSFQDSHYVYNPIDDFWEEKKPIPLARARFGAVSHNDKIYCIGGKTGKGYTGNVQVYNPETNYWESEASLNYPRSHTAAVIINGHLVALSGKTSEGYTNLIEEQKFSSDFYVHRLDRYL